MTDHDALLASILANPADDLPRLILADWLEESERAGTVEVCSYKGCERGHIYTGMDGMKWIPCAVCSGTGRISNGNAERSEFIRVQVELARFKCTFSGPRPRGGCPQCNHEKALRQRERALLEAAGLRHLPGPFWRRGDVYGWSMGNVDNERGNPTYIECEFRRGFVSSVRAPLGVLFGGEPCPTCHQIVSRYDCPTCKGTGRTPGTAPALWGAQPVEECVLTDREPTQNAVDWEWMLRDSDGHASLPESLYSYLRGYTNETTIGLAKYYPTRDAALAALSRAAVNLGRSRAGLPPLPQTRIIEPKELNKV